MQRGMWLWLILSACGNGKATPSDGPLVIDAQNLIDAPVDGSLDAPPPSASVAFGLTMYDYGRLQLGQHATKTFRLWNVGTDPTTTLDVMLAGGGDYSKTADNCDGHVLAPGASCTITVQYAPAAASQTATLTASGVSVALLGTALAGGALTIAPVTIDLAPLATQVFLVTNTGATTSGILSAAMTSTDGTVFPADVTDCAGFDLGPNEPCTISVQFKPIDGTPKAATLFVLANPGGTTTAQITGTGPATAPILVFGPASHDFGQLASPNTGNFTFTVTNFGGGATGTLTSAVQTQLGEFAVAKGQAGDCDGATLAAGASCSVRVVATPSGSVFGLAGGTISLSGNPGGSPSAAVSMTMVM